MIVASKLADEYAVLLKPYEIESLGELRVEPQSDFGTSNLNLGQLYSSTNSSPNSSMKKVSFAQNVGSPVSCKYCHRSRHVMGQCSWLLQEEKDKR